MSYNWMKLLIHGCLDITYNNSLESKSVGAKWKFIRNVYVELLDSQHSISGGVLADSRFLRWPFLRQQRQHKTQRSNQGSWSVGLHQLAKEAGHCLLHGSRWKPWDCSLTIRAGPNFSDNDQWYAEMCENVQYFTFRFRLLQDNSGHTGNCKNLNTWVFE